MPLSGSGGRGAASTSFVVCHIHHMHNNINLFLLDGVTITSAAVDTSKAVRDYGQEISDAAPVIGTFIGFGVAVAGATLAGSVP